MPVNNKYYEKIQGWFNFAEPYEKAVQIAPEDAVFVEVGSWRGKSLIYLASYIIEQGRTDIDLWAIDTWRGSNEPIHNQIINQLGGDDALYNDFIQNIHEAGVAHIISHRREKSIEASKKFSSSSCFFVYIDAGHTYEDVINDIQAWWPIIQAGGVLAGHDYHADSPEVIAAVHDFFGESLLVFPEARTWWIQK